MVLGTPAGVEDLLLWQLESCSKEAHMNVYEDMASSPERMAEYLACWMWCAGCPARERCELAERRGDRPGCAEMIEKKLEEEAE